MTKLELKKWYQERKLSKERKLRRESYHRCKERHDRKRNTALSETKEALWKRKQRQRKKEKEKSRRKSTLDRVHKYRAKQVKQRFRNQSDTERDFKHKMEKSRSINKLRKSLPQTPKRRSAVLQAYLEYKSPTAKTVRKNMFHETQVDGVGSSDEHPNIITEHLFLISPDLNHDHNFSQYTQLQVAEYLRSINYECSRHVFKQNLVKENN
ncbi:hypothetical protein KUTeg_009638 [Tegillarca granosa]|uniref:Uncharacterized protein n=1 Tax=Tegillarca granosa TaxID=220873 RepID=A0ABQ9F7K6_TEGGR|nr:hypothetical protein KUTeg_009638 [Tegillarca granosa]